MLSSILLACVAGKYGPGCAYNCSRHCRDGDSCNTTTGACDTGCKDGYTGEMCDKGYFLVYLTNINIRYMYHFSVLQLSMSIQFIYCQELVVISKDGNLKFDLWVTWP